MSQKRTSTRPVHKSLTSYLPTVSVIIPTFNSVNFLPNALQSVVNQSQLPNEILVVDNGSTDGTIEWVKDYSKHNSLIKYFYEPIKGPSAARNLGIRKSSSEYIAFLDSDDTWLHHKLLDQLRFHNENPAVVMSFCNSAQTCQPIELDNFVDMHYRDTDYKNSSSSFTLADKDIAAQFFYDRILHISSVMVKHSVLISTGLFDTSLLGGEDLDLWIKLALSGRVGSSTTTHVITMNRSDSLSESDENSKIMRECSVIVYKRYKNKIRKISRASVRKARAVNIRYLSLQNRKNHNYHLSCLYGIYIFLLNPSTNNIKSLLIDFSRMVRKQFFRF